MNNYGCLSTFVLPGTIPRNLAEVAEAAIEVTDARPTEDVLAGQKVTGKRSANRYVFRLCRLDTCTELARGYSSQYLWVLDDKP